MSASLSLERLCETSFLCFFTMVNFDASTTQHLEWIQWQQTRITILFARWNFLLFHGANATDIRV